MTDTSITPLRQCTQGDNCINPKGCWLPATLEYFPSCPGRKDKLKPRCRYCQRAQEGRSIDGSRPRKHVSSCPRCGNRICRAESQFCSRKCWLEHAYEMNHRDGKQRCTKCEQWLPQTDDYFPPQKKSKSGLDSWCKQCHAINTKEYLAKNPKPRKGRAPLLSKEVVAAHKKEHKRRSQSHRRARIRKASGRFTKEDINILGRGQGWKCWWCGKSCENKYEIDHRIPLSRGGSNLPENLCISCKFCNQSKNNKMPWEWNGRLL